MDNNAFYKKLYEKQQADIKELKDQISDLTRNLGRSVSRGGSRGRSRGRSASTSPSPPPPTREDNRSQREKNKERIRKRDEEIRSDTKYIEKITKGERNVYTKNSVDSTNNDLMVRSITLINDVKREREYYEKEDQISLCIQAENKAFNDYMDNNDKLFYLNKKGGYEYGRDKFSNINKISDYDYRYWSFKLDDMEPVYTKNMSINKITRENILINDIIYHTKIEHKSANVGKYLSQIGYKERMIFIDINKTGHKLQKVNINSRQYVDVKKISDNKMVSTVSKLHKALIASEKYNISETDNNEFDAYAINKSALTKSSKEVDIKGISSFSEKTNFHGIVKESEYIIDDNYISEELIRLHDDKDGINRLLEILKNIIKFTLIKNKVYYADNGKLIYYTIYMWYISNNNNDKKEIKMPIFKGNIVDYENIKFNLSLEQQMVSLGSDSFQKDAAVLDTTRFFIQTIDIIAGETGGAPKNEDLETYNMCINQKRKDVRNGYLSWCDLVDYPSKKNGCFFKILSSLFKNNVKGLNIPEIYYNNDYISKHHNYLTLWKNLSPDNYESEINVNVGILICSKLNIKLVVYNLDGSIFRSSSIEKPVYTINMILHDNHYTLITNFRDIDDTKFNWSSRNISHTEKKKKEQMDVVMTYYDLETVFNKKHCEQSNLRPYSLSYKLSDKNDVVFVMNHTANINIFNDLFIELSKRRNTRFIFVAYNGSGFDHHFLFNYLVLKKYEIIFDGDNIGSTAPNANNIIYNMLFKISNIFGEYNILQVWDPYLYLHTSLDVAAKDFKLSNNKKAFDHDLVQSEYEKGEESFKDFLNEPNFYNKLKEYNEYDVIVLEELTNKLIESVTVVTEIRRNDILKSPTLPNIAMKLLLKKSNFMIKNPLKFRSDYEELQEDKELYQERYFNTCLPAADYLTDKKIRSAIIGGRVESLPISLNIPMIMVDVVSEYPTMMKNKFFPIGPEKMYRYNIQEYYEATDFLGKPYKEGGRMGLFHIEYDQSNLEGFHNILPVRGEVLDWHNKSINRAWVPCITIRQLCRYGVKYNFVRDGIFAIVWDKSAQVYKSYIEFLENIKNEQDVYLNNNDNRYNASIRQMVKLLLNSVSGKAGQKNYRDRSELIIGLSELKRYFSLNNDVFKLTENDFNLHIISSDTAFITNKLSEEDSYINPPPSQLAVYIYAYAREYMYENTFSKCHVYYSDTDSAIIKLEHYDLIDNKLKCDDFKYGKKVSIRPKKFGDMEIECIFNYLIVISNKTYLIANIDENGNKNIIKYRIKGIRKKDEFFYDGKWYRLNDDNDNKIEFNIILLFEILYNNIVKEKKVTFRSSQIRKFIKEGRLEHRYIEKNI